MSADWKAALGVHDPADAPAAADAAYRARMQYPCCDHCTAYGTRTPHHLFGPGGHTVRCPIHGCGDTPAGDTCGYLSLTGRLICGRTTGHDHGHLYVGTEQGRDRHEEGPTDQ